MGGRGEGGGGRREGRGRGGRGGEKGIIVEELLMS